MRPVVFTNVALAILGVFIFATVTLGNVKSSFLVIFMLICVIVEILGILYLRGIDFSYTPGVHLVLSLGLAVDGQLHICHSFLHSNLGTGNERAKEALRNLGRSVLNGSLSTIIILIPLYIASRYYGSQIFFFCVSGIMVFGLFHSLAVLPVLLSLFKPASYEQVNQKNLYQQDTSNSNYAIS